MICYLLRTGRIIAPFERPVGETTVHTRTLAEQQVERITRAGFQVEWIDSLAEVRSFPSLLISDDLYFTEAALRRFLKHARRRAPGDAAGWQASLEENLLVQRFFTPLIPQPHEYEGMEMRSYDCYYLHRLDPGRTPEEQCKPLLIPNRTRLQRAPVHKLFEVSGDFATPRSTVFFTPIRHWTGLLSANLVGLMGLFTEQFRRRAWSMPLLPLRILARAGSLRPSLLLSKAYLAGRGCKVHHSAHVESSILGNDVRIGPNATVRGCVLADGVEIGPGAVVEGSSVGAGSLIPTTACIRGCVIGRECSIASLIIQFSVLGDRAITCPTGGFTDFVLRGYVQIEHEGGMLPTELRLLGGAAGDDTFLGPGVVVFGGREVPNGCQLVENPRLWVRSAADPPENVARVDRRRRQAKKQAVQRRSA